MTRKERILDRLRELGAEPKRSLGQNFLVSDVVVERILVAARSEPFSEIIEVGPGLGALTEDLLVLGHPLVLLELDAKFAAYWRSRTVSALSPSSSSSLASSVATVAVAPVRVVEGDALRLDWKEFGLSDQALFVSNLPYQISSSLVIERSLEPAGVTRMILMFQKEVAQRLGARPRTKDYGLLTVIAQTFWEITTVCDAGPKDFFPPPNVASRVLQFRLRREFSPGISSDISPKTPPDIFSNGFPEGFLAFVKAAFSHRRKLLARNLQREYFGGVSAGAGGGTLERIEAALKALGLVATARAEELDPVTFVRLYLALRK